MARDSKDARPRRAVVTGGAQGIGREIVLALAREGARIVIADVDFGAAEHTAADARRAGGEALVLTCDVRDARSFDAMAEDADRWLGGVDLLVNNAGVLVVGQLSDLPLADAERVVDVNCWGVVNGCRAFVPRMRARGRGAILNVASLSGWVTLPQMGIYSATKAFVIALSETLHAELAESGIGVTVLCPSFTRSHLVDRATGAADPSTMGMAQRLMGIIGAHPRDVAEVGLRAVRERRLYAVPTVHGRLLWRTKRWFPRSVQRALRLAHEWLVPHSAPGAEAQGVRPSSPPAAPRSMPPPVMGPPRPPALC